MTWAAIGSAAVGAGASYLMNRNSGGSNPTVTTSGAQSQQNINRFTPNPMLNQAYANMLGQANYLSGTPTPYFPGQGYVGPSSLTQRALGMTNDSIKNMNQLNRTARGNYNALSNAADVANNPWVKNQISANEQSVMDTLRNQMLPQLQSGAQSVNALGSSRLGLAQGQALGDASKALSQTNASTMLNAYQQGLGAQQGALQYTGNMLNNFQQPANTALAGGQMVENYQQRALDDAMARFRYQYEEPWMRQQNTSNMLQNMSGVGTQYGSQSQASQNAAPNPNYMSPFQSIVGGAAAGYGLYNQYQQSQPQTYGRNSMGWPTSYYDNWGG